MADPYKLINALKNVHFQKEQIEENIAEIYQVYLIESKISKIRFDSLLEAGLTKNKHYF